MSSPLLHILPFKPNPLRFSTLHPTHCPLYHTSAPCTCPYHYVCPRYLLTSLKPGSIRREVEGFNTLLRVSRAVGVQQFASPPLRTPPSQLRSEKQQLQNRCLWCAALLTRLVAYHKSRPTLFMSPSYPQEVREKCVGQWALLGCKRTVTNRKQLRILKTQKYFKLQTGQNTSPDADSCWADKGILHNCMNFRCWLLWNDTPLNPTFCHLISVQIHIPFLRAVLIRRYHLCLQLKTQWHKIILWIKCSVWDKVMFKSLCCWRAAPSSVNFETNYSLGMW